MARYNRDILVPYLQDICALHFAELEVCAKMFETQKKIIQLRHGKKIEPPLEPKYEEEWDWFSSLVAGAGIFLIFGSIVCLFGSFIGEVPMALGFVLFILSMPMGIFLWMITGAPVQKAKKYNATLLEQYQEKLRIYRKSMSEIEKKNEEARKEIPSLERRLTYLSNERKKITKLLEQSYGAGVLPTQYRDIYAAVYLESTP